MNDCPMCRCVLCSCFGVDEPATVGTLCHRCHEGCTRPSPLIDDLKFVAMKGAHTYTINSPPPPSEDQP